MNSQRPARSRLSLIVAVAAVSAAAATGFATQVLAAATPERAPIGCVDTRKEALRSTASCEQGTKSQGVPVAQGRDGPATFLTGSGGPISDANGKYFLFAPYGRSAGVPGPGYTTFGPFFDLAMPVPPGRTIQNFRVQIECKDCDLDSAGAIIRLFRYTPTAEGSDFSPPVNCKVTLSANAGTSNRGSAQCTSAATVTFPPDDYGDLIVAAGFGPSAKGGATNYGTVVVRWAFEAA
jgi:hypothetical protein